MTAYVLDANVAAKWFLPPTRETLTTEASRMLRDFSEGRVRLIAPDLFWPEFGNVLWKAVRQKRISRNVAEESIEALEDIGIAAAPSPPLLKTAFAIAVGFNQSVYDGVYVALAVATSTPLVTADERLANALAARFPVRWLGAL